MSALAWVALILGGVLLVAGIVAGLLIAVTVRAIEWALVQWTEGRL